MNSFTGNRAQSLSEWLETATKGLVAPARERIQTEIEAHYTEAVAAHVADGMRPAAAEMLALEDLGDARKAGKEFRKRHLTQEEAEYIGRVRNSRSASWLFVTSIACFAVLAGFVYSLRSGLYPKGGYGAFLAVAILHFIAMPLGSKLMDARVGKGPGTSWFLFAVAIEGITWGFVMMAAFQVNSLTISCLLALSGLPMAIRPLRLWNKIRKSRDAWTKPPSLGHA